MVVKNVVASVIAASGKNSVSQREVVRIMTSVVENPVTAEEAEAMIADALKNGEIMKWRGRGGSLRNAGPAPVIAAYGSKCKNPRKPTKAQMKDEAIRQNLSASAVEETEGAL